MPARSPHHPYESWEEMLHALREETRDRDPAGTLLAVAQPVAGPAHYATLLADLHAEPDEPGLPDDGDLHPAIDAHPEAALPAAASGHGAHNPHGHAGPAARASQPPAADSSDPAADPHGHAGPAANASQPPPGIADMAPESRRLIDRLDVELAERLPLLRHHVSVDCDGCDRLLTAYQSLLPTLVALRDEVTDARSTATTTRGAIIDALRSAFPLQVDHLEHGARPQALTTFGPYELADHLIAWALELREESVHAGEERARREHRPLIETNEGLRQNVDQLRARATQARDDAANQHRRHLADLEDLGVPHDIAIGYLNGDRTLTEALYHAAASTGRLHLPVDTDHAVELVAHQPWGSGIPTKGTLAELVSQPDRAPTGPQDPAEKPPPGVDPHTGEVHAEVSTSADHGGERPPHNDRRPQRRRQRDRNRGSLNRVLDTIDSLGDPGTRVLDALYTHGDVTLGRLTSRVGVSPSHLREALATLVAAQALVTVDINRIDILVAPTPALADAAHLDATDQAHPNFQALSDFTPHTGAGEALRVGAVPLTRLLHQHHSLSALSTARARGPKPPPPGLAAILKHDPLDTGNGDGTATGTSSGRGLLLALTGPAADLNIGPDPGALDTLWISHDHPDPKLAPERIRSRARAVWLIPASSAYETDTWRQA